MFLHAELVLGDGAVDSPIDDEKRTRRFADGVLTWQHGTMKSPSVTGHVMPSEGPCWTDEMAQEETFDADREVDRPFQGACLGRTSGGHALSFCECLSGVCVCTECGVCARV